MVLLGGIGPHRAVAGRCPATIGGNATPPRPRAGAAGAARARAGAARPAGRARARAAAASLLLARPERRPGRRGDLPARRLHRAALSVPPLGGRGAGPGAPAGLEPVPLGRAPVARRRP